MRTILYISLLIIFYTISLSFSGKGSGTKDDPYQITTISQLQEINNEPNSNYILMNDIDASETKNWNVGDHDGDTTTPNVPMGFSPMLLNANSSLNGNGKIIKNLFINRPLESSVALFRLAGGDIKKLGLENCNITGCYNVSSLCAQHGNEWTDGIIEECYTTGFVNVKGHGNVNSGFCGYLTGGIIKNSYSLCVVSDETALPDYNSTSFSDVFYTSCSIERCYTIGKVISPKKVTAFGLVDNIYLCFWDTETTGILDTINSGDEENGLPTSEMKKKATYTAWDFDSVWCIDEGRDYPKLRAFGKCPGTDVPQEPSKENNFIISPNPVSDKLIIQQKNIINTHYEIINLLGIKVMSGELSGDYTTINITQLSKGLYFLKIGNDVRKFVKE